MHGRQQDLPPSRLINSKCTLEYCTPPECCKCCKCCSLNLRGQRHSGMYSAATSTSKKVRTTDGKSAGERGSKSAGVNKGEIKCRAEWKQKCRGEGKQNKRAGQKENKSAGERGSKSLPPCHSVPVCTIIILHYITASPERTAMRQDGPLSVITHMIIHIIPSAITRMYGRLPQKQLPPVRQSGAVTRIAIHQQLESPTWGTAAVHGALQQAAAEAATPAISAWGVKLLPMHPVPPR